VAKVTTSKPISRVFMRAETLTIYGSQQHFRLRGHPIAKTPEDTTTGIAQASGSQPAQAKLPPMPSGKVAIPNAPGVTVDEEDVIGNNLASRRGFKHFPSHYVRYRYFGKR
jgi:hypothetical protein